MKNFCDNTTLGISIIWAAVIFGSAVVLKGTNYFSQLLPILAGGAAGSLIVTSNNSSEES